MDCPTCGKSLTTERGMCQHHTKVHGDPLPNRTCSGCGVEFYDPKARREYCDGCNPNAGRHNGNWKGAKEAAECRICGSEFEYYPSDKEGVYCPACVAESDEFLGEPFEKDAERVTKECAQCGVEMSVLRSDIDRGEGRFCSFECLCAWMSENRVGENHHGWKKGKTEYKGEWWSVRWRALERDDHTCRRCGESAEDMG